MSERGSGELAPGVWCLPLPFLINVYLVEHSAGWALIDAGAPWHFEKILAAARARFGDAPPTGIFLTHGHPDHAGSALALSTHWDAPIYASEAELAFLTGKLDYPPGDPGVGGPTGFFARFMPSKGFDLGKRIAPLPPGLGERPLVGSPKPGGQGAEHGQGDLPGWQVVPLPGHTPGQVGFWRESDRTLLAGDALTTRELNNWVRFLRGEERFGMPPAAFTCDWFAVRKSILKIGELAPNALGAGHGRPMTGAKLKAKLGSFLEYSSIPRKGRYVAQPVQVLKNGTLDIPMTPPDPVEKAAKFLVLGAVLSLGAWWLVKNKRYG